MALPAVPLLGGGQRPPILGKRVVTWVIPPDAQVVSRESSGGVIRTLSKAMTDGNRYLFAYNTRNSPTRVTWTLAAPAADAVDLSSGQGTKVDGGAITTELAPYEVRRLRLR